MERRSRVAKPVLHRYRLRLARASGRRAEGVVNRRGGPPEAHRPAPESARCVARLKVPALKSVPLIAWCESEGVPFSFPFTVLAELRAS